MADTSLPTESVSYQENWKPIPDWEGYYEVSDLGRVRSLPRTIICPNNQGQISTRSIQGRILKPKLTQFGYHTVALCRDAEMRHHFVHRLVCQAFIGPRPSEDHEVAHGDAIRTDNRLKNLRWATKQENGADKVRHGNSLIGEKHAEAKLTEAAAREIIATKGLKRSGARTREMARRFGVSVATIHKVRSDKTRWKHLKGD